MKKILILLLCFASGLYAQAVKVLPGIDVLTGENFSVLNGKRVGLITNQTGVNSKLESSIDVLNKAGNFKLAALFSPEHGIRGYVPGGIAVEHYTDSLTNLPVYSLYGGQRKPTKEMLKDIDVLVYDIQDIGCRAYTYISTLGLAMEAAAENGIEFVVLDRPNPLGGNRVEGSLARDGFVSFVSQFKIPYVYGLTCGELATVLNREKMLSGGVQCKLTVIPMSGWKRDMIYSDTGLQWVPPSPHVPSSDTPFYLVSSGILGELQVISIGIGYTLPFRTFAAQWINPDSLANNLNALNLEGVKFRPISYKPFFSLGKDTLLSGVQIHITDYYKADLMQIQFYFIQVQNAMYPHKNIFKMAAPSRLKMFDLVLGTDEIRNAFSKNMKVSDISGSFADEAREFREKTKKYYLYN